MKDVFKKRRYVCVEDPVHRFEAMRWESEGLPSCPECGGKVDLWYGRNFFGSAQIISDEIDIEIRHGLCNEDGTPKRWRSMSELRKAASEKGLVIFGETPKPTTQLAEQRAREKEERAKRW